MRRVTEADAATAAKLKQVPEVCGGPDAIPA